MKKFYLRPFLRWALTIALFWVWESYASGVALNIQLPDFDFSSLITEKYMASGSLKMGSEKESQTVTFGKEGQAFGILFSSEQLPTEFKNQFGKREFIQIVMLSSEKAEKPSSFPFGLMSFFLMGNASKAQVGLELSLPQKTQGKDFAHFILMSPVSPIKSDEDRLKRTFFGQGQVLVELLSGSEIFQVLKEKRNFRFERRRCSIEVNSNLSSPFVEKSFPVTGKLVLTLFRPANAFTEGWLASTLKQSLTKGSDPARDLSASSGGDAPVVQPPQEKP